MREQIVAKIPPHRCFVEIFAGAAWVLFAKPLETSKCEVLNDLDGELINFWRVLKHRPAEFTEAASWLLASRELWTAWRKLENATDEIDRAVRFYVVIKLGFGAQRIPTSFGSRANGRPAIWWPRLREEAAKIIERLRIVWIEHLPWQECLAKFDAADAFFYIDPPYRCYGSKAYAHKFGDNDHAALAQALLTKTRGKWLLSYNADPFLERLYRARGIAIERVSVPYSIARAGRADGRELLIRNY